MNLVRSKNSHRPAAILSARYVQNDRVTLSQAKALTLGGHDTQRRVIEEIESGNEFGAEPITEFFTDNRPAVAIAIFPLEKLRRGRFTCRRFVSS